jgi:hypothetical protein
MRRWRRDGVSTEVALARFDGPPAIEPDELIGAWRGTGMPTGHPLDGLLERLDWWGKRVESEERVHPLIFGAGVALDPRWVPLGLAQRWPRLARSAPRPGPVSPFSAQLSARVGRRRASYASNIAAASARR